MNSAISYDGVRTLVHDHPKYYVGQGYYASPFQGSCLLLLIDSLIFGSKNILDVKFGSTKTKDPYQMSYQTTPMCSRHHRIYRTPIFSVSSNHIMNGSWLIQSSRLQKIIKLLKVSPKNQVWDCSECQLNLLVKLGRRWLIKLDMDDRKTNREQN